MGSVYEKARIANGRSRMCESCLFFCDGLPRCPQSVRDVCDKAFKKGYVKGYYQSTKDKKEQLCKSTRLR